jgi:hypothetical protein
MSLNQKDRKFIDEASISDEEEQKLNDESRDIRSKEIIEDSPIIDRIIENETKPETDENNLDSDIVDNKKKSRKICSSKLSFK